MDQQISQSTLAKKDKSSLVEIVTQLGGAPNSRAKKADLIGMILELSGASPAEPQRSPEARNAPATNGTVQAPSAAAPNLFDQSPNFSTEPQKAEGPALNDTADLEGSTAQHGSSGADEPSPNGRAGSDESGANHADPTLDPSRYAVRRPQRQSGGSGADGASDESAGPAAASTHSADSRVSDAPRDTRGGEATGDSDSGDGPQRDRPNRRQRAEQGQRGEQSWRESGQRESGQKEQGPRDSNQKGQKGDQGPKGKDQGNQGNQGNQGDGQGDDQGDPRGRRRRRGRNRENGNGQQPQPQEVEPVLVSGYLDLRDEGYGFLRVKGYLPSRDDAYVPAKLARQLGLRKGDFIEGASRPQGRGDKNAAMVRIDRVAGMDPEVAKKRPNFDDLTPLFPDVKLKLENDIHPQNMTARIIDLIAPIGKGQRGLIVSPPKAGKTTIMKTIAQCIEMNSPDVELMVLLVDERPEEVTDMRRSVKGEVIGSTFDRPSDEHTHVAELTIERAKRRVELGKDVVVILDGITRLARAYNLAAPATGRIMSGGIDSGALYPPKRFFGSARNIEEGGSLTILATALVDTGSLMDNIIFEEFKGTGNMELRLDRKAAERRVFPAIDVDASSTRHEELLFDRQQLNIVWKLRRVISGVASDGTASAALELLTDRMATFASNDLFLKEIARAPGGV